MAIKVIIFDFDGTIADTYQAIVDITNSLASEFGYKTLNQEELSFLKNLSSGEIIRQSEISLFKLPFLVKRVQKELGKQIGELAPILGMRGVLQKLKQQGYVLGIITSNIQDNVTTFLQHNGLESCFDFIHSGTSIFGKHRIINQVIRRYSLRSTEAIYVGDETRDIRSARKSNVGSIAVTWGFNSEKVLAKHNPDYLIVKPEELLDAIISRNQSQLSIMAAGENK
ncbi:MAG: HAD hydrolase-like protein [Xenococcaceae cyanobacterium MO_207.B15]|nr:HAD hydrolase-like protein [Xenococcaceae cyanobacterium MO_207.B15]